MNSSKNSSAIALIIAGIIAVAGAIIVVLALLTPVSFGWFAYAPLSDAVFLPSVIALPAWTLVGVVHFIAGLVTISYLIGKRRGRRA